MKVCHLSTVHPLNDNRVFHKQCKALAEAGYDVSLIITHDKNETKDGVRIISLQPARNRCHRFLVQSLRCLRHAVREKARVYHFHDPELIFVGLLLKLLGKKVIFDVHENIPQQVLNKEWLGPLWLRRAISRCVIGVQKCCGVVFDRIITARPDIAEYWKSDRVTVVMNSASLSTIDSTPIAQEPKDRPVVIYAGGLSRIRGIKELIDAMTIVGDRAQLWLLGLWDNDDFFEECRQAPGWKYVKYLGYKTVQEVFGLMKRCDIGIITFLPAPNHLTTIATKPFEYMACRLPVIMSDFEYWRSLFGDHVLYVDPASPRDIAEKVLELLDNANAASLLRAAGRKLVEERFSWEAERGKLLSLYAGLAH